MRIKPEEVRQVAQLAKLTLTDDEVRQYTKDFDSILEHFAVIDEYELADEQLKPMSKMSPQPLRQDQPTLFTDQKKLHRNVKEMEDGLIVVPKILD